MKNAEKRRGKNVSGKTSCTVGRKRKGMSFSEVCDALCKPYGYVRQVQARLDLPWLDREGYDETYVAFLKSVVALRTFGVSFDDISEILETEKKILRLLHVDTINSSQTWFLDFCGVQEAADGDRLLLTRYNLSQAVTDDGVQFHLDFGTRGAELFSGAEMGEDVQRLMALYTRQVEGIRQRVRTEEPVLRDALQWATRVFRENG